MWQCILNLVVKEVSQPGQEHVYCATWPWLRLLAAASLIFSDVTTGFTTWEGGAEGEKSVAEEEKGDAEGEKAPGVAHPSPTPRPLSPDVSVEKTERGV